MSLVKKRNSSSPSTDKKGSAKKSKKQTTRDEGDETNDVIEHLFDDEDKKKKKKMDGEEVNKKKKKAAIVEEEDDPIEEEEEEEEDKKQQDWLATYNEGTVVIKTKDDLRQHFVGLAGDPTQTVYHPVIMHMMNEDLKQAKFHTYEFFMMDDFANVFEFEVEAFKGAFGEAYKVFLTCPLLCGKDKLEIYPPPCAIRWFKGSPLGNFHPEPKDDRGDNDLAKCNMAFDMSLSCPRSEPDLEKPLKRFREFLEAVYNKGSRFMYEHPKLALPIKKCLAEKKTFEGSKKLITDAQRKALFFEAPYRRPLYRPVKADDKYPDPHIISVRGHPMRVTFPTESEAIAKNGYKAPLPILQNYHDFVRPAKKEGKPQSYNVSNWYKVFDFDGKPIKRHDLPELRAFDPTHPDYDSKRGFVDPEKRSSIENGDLCIPSFTIEFTVFTGKVPDYGLRFSMEGPGIRKWKRKPDNMRGGSSDVFYDPDAEDEKEYLPLPGASVIMPAVQSITHASQLMITHVEDDDLLKAEMPQPSAPPSEASIVATEETTSMQIEEITTTTEEEETSTQDE